MLFFRNEDRRCGTCAHYGRAFAVTVTPPGGGPVERAPCLCHAVEPDAGEGAVVLLGPESHCRCHADSWEADAAASPAGGDGGDDGDNGDDDHGGDGCAIYGVRPGVDFPWTLRRPREGAFPPPPGPLY